MEFQAVSGPKFTGLFSVNAGGIAIIIIIIIITWFKHTLCHSQ